MPELIEQVVEIGRDAYGRRVTATRSKNNGRPTWKLEIHPSSQQDDGERMWSLTDDNLRDLVRALDVVKR
jgi:hypothetical protein